MKRRENKRVVIHGHGGGSMNETTFRNAASSQGHGFGGGDPGSRMFLPYLGQGYGKSGRPRIGHRWRLW
jgi:hypothetical protein